MGAAGLLWVSLALITPGVLGERGGGARREGAAVWGRKTSAPPCKAGSKARRWGQCQTPACLLLALGDPWDLWVLEILTLGLRGWDHRTWRRALWDVPGEAVGALWVPSGCPRLAQQVLLTLRPEVWGHAAGCKLHRAREFLQPQGPPCPVRAADPPAACPESELLTPNAQAWCSLCISILLFDLSYWS